MKNKLTSISTGHQVGFIKLSDEDAAALGRKKLNSNAERGTVYAVCNFGDPSIPFLYVEKVTFLVEKALPHWSPNPTKQVRKKEWLVWYRGSKKMWSSYGKTRIEAVEGAIKDGWLYA